MKSTQRQFCANILHFLKSGFPKLHISPTPDSGGHPRAWLPHAPKSSNRAGRGGAVDHDPTSRVWCTTSSSKHSAYWCERCACKAKRGGEKQHFAKFPPLQLGCTLRQASRASFNSLPLRQEGRHPDHLQVFKFRFGAPSPRAASGSGATMGRCDACGATRSPG